MAPVIHAPAAASRRRSARPQPKIINATRAGSLVTIAIWLMSLKGVDIPPAVAAAVTTLLAGGAGYVTPSVSNP
jgi:NaMN:DMB phosphoribosyltransferase